MNLFIFVYFLQTISIKLLTSVCSFLGTMFNLFSSHTYPSHISVYFNYGDICRKKYVKQKEKLIKNFDLKNLRFSLQIPEGTHAREKGEVKVSRQREINGSKKNETQQWIKKRK